MHKHVFAPTVVASVPVDSGRCMMQMPDGEIRLYGYNVHAFRMSPDEIVPIVMKSRNGGSSWITEEITTQVPGAMSASPWSGRFLTFIRATKDRPELHLSVRSTLSDTLADEGVYCV